MKALTETIIRMFDLAEAEGLQRIAVEQQHHAVERLERAEPDAFVMHPGPMNRGIEIDSTVADHPTRSLITRQVEMGVAIRMACLEVLTRRARRVPGWDSEGAAA